MKKRIIAMLLVLAMAVGLSAQVVTAATPATYDVGYAKVDINPYEELRTATDFENFAPSAGKEASLLELPISGGSNGSVKVGETEDGKPIYKKEYMSTDGKVDDNGDGKVDINDGLFATCIAVTDASGNTALIYTLDLLSAYKEILHEVRTILLDEYKDIGLSTERILMNGSHTHSGPGITADYEGVYSTNYTFTEDYKIYKEFLVFQLVKAARLALADRATATMHKGTIDASESNAAKNKIGDTLNNLRSYSGRVTELKADRYGADKKVYNSVRHYLLTAQEAGTADSYGKYSVKAGGKTISYIAGNNFNGDWKTGTAEGGWFTIDVTNTDGTVTKYVITGVQPVSETDDKMHILKFVFENSSKAPVVLVNFRGHLPSPGSKFVMSSSMANSLRYILEKNGYRASYLQGAAGNVNSSTKQPEGLWMSYPTQESVDSGIFAKYDTSHDGEKHNIYGTELAELALECLGANMKAVTSGGDIRSTQYTYQSERKIISDLEYAAAKEYIRRVNLPADDANKLGITDSMLYTDSTTNEQISISSIFHANAVNSSYSKNSSAGDEVSLCALTIGKGFAMVSASGELFDRYDKDGDLTKNLWDNLIDNNTYGTPFVAGYGGNDGYFGSVATFNFTQDTIDAGNISLVAGSYETLTNSYKSGIGEALVEQMDVMLDFLTGDVSSATQTKKCPHCGETVNWQAYNPTTASNVWPVGHFYLTKNIAVTDMETGAGADVCIDLNGYNMDVYKGIKVTDDSVLSIMDNRGDGIGTVTGYEATNLGGIAYIASKGTLNLYNGTLQYAGTKNQDSHANGGILNIDGKFNMYGGTVEGTEVNWTGGAMYISKTGVARFAGGTVTKGKAGARSHCVANCGTVILSGNPNVADIDTFGGGVPVGDALIFDGKFTGVININNPAAGTDIGNAINNADLIEATITMGGTYTNNVHVEGNDVYSRTRTQFAYRNEDNTVTYTNDLPQGDGDKTYVLQHSHSKAMQVAGNLRLDLNGYNVTGNISVADGKTLQIADCKTADFDISDGLYGKIKATGNSGNIIAAEATEKTDLFLMVKEGNYQTFHAVDLNINAMSWKPESQGIYYKHEFVGDETIADKVVSYGVALSLTEAPTNEKLQEAAKNAKKDDVVIKGDGVIYTRFAGEFGSDVGTSTLVTGIMKEENGYLTNRRNASQPIYGRAYALLSDGTYILGVTRNLSLQQLVEKFDAQWNTLSQDKRNSLLRAYKNTSYNRVMKEWNLPNIKNPTLTQVEEDTLRILAIGNSHTVDATSMLAEVFAAESPEQKVMIGNMYRSGCSVGQHVSYAKNNTVIYTYYRNIDGQWNPVINAPAPGQNVLSDGLRDQCWDVVMLHEMNADAVLGENITYKNNYENLKKHIDYVNANSLTEPKILWNLSWANPTSADLLAQGDSIYSKWSSDYRTYSNGDYTTMFSNIISKSQQYIFNNDKVSGEIEGIAPTGTAICYARNVLGLGEKTEGLHLYRDYTHMSDLGRLISGYVWYATITGKTSISAVNVDYVPGSCCNENLNTGFTVTQEMKDVIIASVNYALANPMTAATK